MARGTPGYLGPYRLLNIVHTGHASLIWQAYDDDKQRIVGVKTLHEADYGNREQINFLRREYTIGQGLHHPNVVEIYPVQWDSRQPYFAMEWFSSPNLKQRLNQGGRDKLAPFFANIVEQSCRALSYLHNQGWVHCDVKPDNFLLSDDGELKLIDFALAKRAKRGVAKWLTPKAKPQGTKSYISPEQLRGQTLDGRADLYSLACMMHELLAGKPPFTGTSANDLLNKQIRSLPPPLEALNSNVTPEFTALIRRAMSKNREHRSKTVDDFLMEFRMIRVFKIQPPVEKK
ncbi:MAG: serine/threonine protein kinase [Pirellulales bacterium]|nr:serine/threonine protein kinase [Pirellulales bacterium]